MVARTELPDEALKRPLKTYSRGMLQRVGLAQALIGEPSLLFLDEPASGMDPLGVAMVRRLIKEARDGGATVVLNSHQIQEVGRVCDRVAFLSNGRVERLDEMRHEGADRHGWSVRVRAGQEESACRALASAGFSASATSPGLLYVTGPLADLERVAPALVAAGVALLELTEQSAHLEALFSAGPHA